MFPKATKGDRFTKVWSKEFYNYLLDQIRQDLNLTAKPKSFTYDPVKALKETTGSYVGFTPVALVTSSQIRGGFKSPVIKVGDLDSSLPFGVLQSHCTETQASDLIVEGVSWCHVTVTNVAHKYAAISGTDLVSQTSSNGAVARIIAPVTTGPSLIQLPLPGNRCPDLPEPGSYQAIAGETIAPGEVGDIVYNGVVYEVLNHTLCEVNMGNPVTFVVSPDCSTHFTTCICCESTVDPCVSETCCCEPFAFCINGFKGIAVADPGTFTLICGCINNYYCCESLLPNGIPTNNCYPVEEEDPPFGSYLFYPAIFEGKLYCDGSSTYLDWTVTKSNGLDLDPTIYTGTKALPDFCSGTTAFTINPGGCPINIKIGRTLADVDCDTADQVTDCCDKQLWYCLNNDSVQLPSGGSHTFNTTDCCDGDCTTSELRVRIDCDSESVNPLSLNWQFWCDGVQVDAGAINISAFCSSNTTTLYTITPGCFLQIQVSVGNIGCYTCEGGPTGTTVPPPPGP